MYKKIISAAYALNIIFQAFFTLAMPIGFGALFAYLLVSYASMPEWIYAPSIIIGVLMGFYSMIKFVISAMAGLERLEKQRGDTSFKNSESPPSKTDRLNE